MRSELVATHYTCNQRCGHCTARRIAGARGAGVARVALGLAFVPRDEEFRPLRVGA